MKKAVVLLFFLLAGLSYSQEVQRVIVDGEITVPPGDEPEGVSIVNTTSRKATISGENGKFLLAVAAGDVITFSALQFQKFTIIIDKNVVDAKKLHVFVTEATTELPEVVVRSITLSGIVEVDLNRIPVTDPNNPDISAEDIYNATLTMEPGPLSTPENIAMRDSFMEYGLNFANIFRAIVSTEEVAGQDLEPLDEEIRKLYDDEFFKEYLDIDRSQISAFITYARDNGLTKNMLKEGNELELVHFLIDKSREFKSK